MTLVRGRSGYERGTGERKDWQRGKAKGGRRKVMGQILLANWFPNRVGKNGEGGHRSMWVEG